MATVMIWQTPKPVLGMAMTVVKEHLTRIIAISADAMKQMTQFLQRSGGAVEMPTSEVFLQLLKKKVVHIYHTRAMANRGYNSFFTLFGMKL